MDKFEYYLIEGEIFNFKVKILIMDNVFYMEGV